MFATIWLPRFRLQAALRWRGAVDAAALVDEQSARSVIIEANAAAEARGVRAGMPSTQALARCAGLRILPRSPAQEAACNAVVLEIAGAFSPRVELTADGACTLDLRRAPRGACWQRMAESMRARLGAGGLDAWVGVAPNADHAMLAAKCAGPVSVVYDAAEFCARLPVEALDPTVEMRDVLRDWGIGTVGELMGLPRTQFIERLGPDAGALWKLIAGRSKRLLRVEPPPEVYAEAFDFERGIETTEPLLFLLRRFLDSLAGRLRAAGRVASRMLLTLPLADGSSHEREFGIPAPTSDVEVLFRILNTHLDALRLDQEPIGVRLGISPCDPENRQLHLFERSLRDPNRFGETLARLKAIVGEGCVGVPSAAESHRPGAYEVLGLGFQDWENEPETLNLNPETSPTGLPLRRYRPGVAAVVKVRRGAPVHVAARGFGGTVAEAAGPYRVSGDWWDRDAWSVEEWDVELAGGGLLRLSRQREGWKLEGCYDV